MDKCEMPRALLAATIACSLLAPAARADEGTLQAEIEALRAEVAVLKEEVRQMRDARVAAETGAPGANVATPVSVAKPPSADSSALTATSMAASTTLWGYGELNYNHPTAHAADTQADLRRAVIGFSHAFDESTHVYGELEWEHAVTSADDSGESEVEQLYIEHALAPEYGVRAGLMLVPLGLLNEHHEPTNYYGVERNFVETAIIPSTWREGGVALYGNTDSGLNWSAGVSTGPDLGKWDPAADEERASPLASIHQELQLARAHDPALFAAANWTAIPGLTLGGGAFGGKIGQGTDSPAQDSRLFLGEVHARWQTGPFDLSALYARGSISDTQALNATFAGQPTPVPKTFWGGYAQAAWRALAWGESSLAPFLRYEQFNTGAAYAAQAEGTPPPLPTEKVWTAGINYYLNPNVVFKIDYQDFNRDETTFGYGDRFNLGIGYQF
jgi:hypothetical protein